MYYQLDTLTTAIYSSCRGEPRVTRTLIALSASRTVVPDVADSVESLGSPGTNQNAVLSYKYVVEKAEIS